MSIAALTRPVEPPRAEPSSDVASFDFRRPAAFGRETVRGLSGLHELFTRRLTTAWGGALRAVVQLEEVAVDQVSYGDYVAAMPSPNVLATVSLAPLPAPALVELDVQLALLLVDRLLGGRGTANRAKGPRRLTDVETVLLEHLLGHVTDALADSLRPVGDVAAELRGIDYNPQLVQVAAPSDRVVLLTYDLSVSQGLHAGGLLTLCYPAATITPVLDQVRAQLAGADDDAEGAAPSRLDGPVRDLEVTLHVASTPSWVDAADVVSLRPGDVLCLDHRAADPLVAHVGDTPVFTGYIGRRGRRTAVQAAGDLLTGPA